MYLQPDAPGQGAAISPRSAAVWLLVLNEAFYGAWIRIDGTAEIVDQPEALDLLVDVFRSIRGGHPDWDDYPAPR